MRSYDAVYSIDSSFPATVSPFTMDKFEVTVGRFQNFVAVYPANVPKAGQGRSHSPDDGGWDPSWPMPASAKDLTDQLACDGGTWQNPPATDPLLAQRPVNCVSFYLAYAFCIWEGGRLPTEAEWNYAAAGGSEQRIYPWSSPHDNSDIGPQNAVYVDDADPNGLPNTVGSRACVGSTVSCGDGRWGHSDLVGNVLEWTLDYYADPYPSMDCLDCVNASAQAARVLRGGSYKTPLVAVEGAALLSSSYRWSDGPLDFDNSTGFRCVYDLLR
jgi:formylglycine-generating enzyme required for sulfatase activity